MNSIKFKNETGAILSSRNDIITIIDGTSGAVDFPSEFIMDFHKQKPGHIYALTHVHPPGMTELSSRDKTTMRAWARAMYPFPFRLIVISETKDDFLEGIFVETCFTAFLEPKEIWLLRGKETKREVTIVREYGAIRLPRLELEHKSNTPFPLWYGELLIERSYGHED